MAHKSFPRITTFLSIMQIIVEKHLFLNVLKKTKCFNITSFVQEQCSDKLIYYLNNIICSVNCEALKLSTLYI